MTEPVPPTRLVILEDRRGARGDDVPLRMRRYRIARLRPEHPRADAARRFEYLKRGHD